MTVLPLGDVKSHLSKLVSRVHDYHERVTVTVHGRPSRVSRRGCFAGLAFDCLGQSTVLHRA